MGKPRMTSASSSVIAGDPLGGCMAMHFWNDRTLNSESHRPLPFHNMRDPIRATSCTDAWLQAANHLRSQTDWKDYNLILEISRPMALTPVEARIAGELDRFL